MCLNRLGLLAFPRACEDVYLVPARMHRQRGGKAIFLKAAVGEVVIEHETNLHLPASEPEVNFAAMRKMIVIVDAVLAVVLPLYGFRS